jgi:SulP family sulfate permease
LSTLIQQASAIAVVALLSIMISIPFGASYFPIGWKAEGSGTDRDSDATGTGGDGDISGNFPLPGKQALGIRMFLFATIMGQLAFTFSSRFENPVGLQMVENVPFLDALCHIVIQEQGYGIEALSTVCFLFGLSSILVGLTFYLLGKWKLGRIVYFFPNHVLVGCIGGIGVFLIITAIEVTSDTTFTFDRNGIVGVLAHWELLVIVVGFELVLRCLQHATKDKYGNAKYPLLSPIYYCMITPLFYLGLFLFGVSTQQATDRGFFFPAVEDNSTAPTSSSTSVWYDPHLWDMFTIVNLTTLSWTAIFQSAGTMIALAAFSLIHVPINIPAFAISTDVGTWQTIFSRTMMTALNLPVFNVVDSILIRSYPLPTDTDMNQELIAHGYANMFSGAFGGLQTYMTYSNSVLYAKSGGKGKISSLLIVAMTMLLFVIGPSIASFLPRCMAGTLLLHIGIDLALEGVYDCTFDVWICLATVVSPVRRPLTQTSMLHYCSLWSIR